MNNDEHEQEPAKKTSLVKKILWGGLITGAVIAVAAVVGFVFFPEQTAQVVNAIREGMGGMYGGIGQIGTDITNAMGGPAEQGTLLGTVQSGLTSAYNAVGNAGGWIAEKIGTIDPSKAVGGVSGFFTGIVDPAKAAGASGAVGFIMNNKILSLAGAGVGAYAISQMTDNKPQQEQEEHHHRQHEVRESFALREDMRKMNAVMTARARAEGYQPVAAQGRS